MREYTKTFPVDNFNQKALANNTYEVSWASANETLLENSASGLELCLTLNTSIDRTLTLNIVTEDGTAQAGQDYTAIDTNLNIPSGDSHACTTLSAIDDNSFETKEDLSVKAIPQNFSETITVGGSSVTIQKVRLRLPLAVAVALISDESPLGITTRGPFEADENQMDVTTLGASYQGVPQTAGMTWSMGGGEDQDHFSLTQGGVLSFKAPKDFEKPDDADKGGTYKITVQVTDGTHTQAAELEIQLQDVNEAPVIETLGLFGVDEGETLITTLGIVPGDPGDSYTWSKVGGADADHFSLGAASGELDFTSAKDFEAAADDDDGDRVYELTIQVSDSGQLTDRANLIVQLRDVEEGVAPDPAAPVIDTLGPFSVKEDQTYVATLEANYSGGGTLTWSITGGEDQSHFILAGETGDLVFNGLKDFDDPEDGNQNNLYHVDVKVSDETHETTASLLVQLQNVNEPPVIRTQIPLSVVEGQMDVIKLEATSEYMESDKLTWSIQGGVDAAHFSLTEAGKLSFKEAKSVESPDDDNGDGVYELIVGVSDGAQSTTAEMEIELQAAQGKSEPPTSSTDLASKSDSGGGCATVFLTRPSSGGGPGSPGVAIHPMTRTHSPGDGGWKALFFLGVMLFPVLLVRWLQIFSEK